jgi:uncharacterized repeat protein (TIGR01451 family)
MKNWQHNLQWLIVSSAMAMALSACQGPVQEATFQVTGHTLLDTTVDGSEIIPAEAVVTNTGNAAGTPPNVTFKITSDLVFINIESALYNCDDLSQTVLLCTAKEGTKLEPLAEVKLQPLFQIAYAGETATVASAAVTGTRNPRVTFPIGIESPVLAASIFLPQIIVIPSSKDFDLSIAKTVSKPFVAGAGGSGEFEITVTIPVNPTPALTYIKVQDPIIDLVTDANGLVVLDANGKSTPTGFQYNISKTNLLSPAWECQIASGGFLSCNLRKVPAVTGVIPLPIAGKYPVIKVAVDVTANASSTTKLNCPYVRPTAPMGDIDSKNNRLGSQPDWTNPCTPYGIKTDLAITKTQIAPKVTPDDTFYWDKPGKYQIVVTNNTQPPAQFYGPFTITDVITQNFPPGPSYTPAFTATFADIFLAADGWTITSGPTATNQSSQWTCTGVYPNISCSHPGPIAASGSLPPLILGVKLKPYSVNIAEGQINCARLPSDTNLTNNESCVGSQNEAMPLFDLKIIKTHTNTPVVAGGVINYALNVLNFSANTAPGPIIVTDVLPAGFVSTPAPLVSVIPAGAATCTVTPPSVTPPTIKCISSGSLVNGQGFTVNIAATTDANAALAITNTATVTNNLDSGDTNLQNNTSSDTLTLEAEVLSPCDDAATLDTAGNVVFPADASDIEPMESVDEDRGAISSLYPGVDTTTDSFYPLPCETSIGGTLPVDVPPTQDEITAAANLGEVEGPMADAIITKLRLSPLPPIQPLIPPVPSTAKECAILVGDGLVTKPCNDPVFLDNTMPFGGRDIIYVHGLATGDLLNKLKDPKGAASQVWPQDKAAFLDPTGYFRQDAEKYWHPHIEEHLTQGWEFTSSDSAPVYAPKSNRYLLIAWSSNQTLEYAQHTMLTQIQLAMTPAQTNVVTPPSYPTRFKRSFCSNGCVIMTHSTGALITDTAMARASRGYYGQAGKDIASQMAVHVSFAGAISGSRIATVGMAVGLGLAGPAVTSNLLCLIWDGIIGTSNTCNANTSFVASSILRDLIPAVSQGIWGSDVASTPVATVTFAGGHPRGNQALGLTQFILPGVDDGVASMNSACANPTPIISPINPPSGMVVSSLLKAFEFSENGDRFARGAKILISQKNLLAAAIPFYFASACTPWLSASGMVLPVINAYSGTPSDARQRYPNHYSFIQSLAEHSYDGGASAGNPWPSSNSSSASALRQYEPKVTIVPPQVSGINVEESRAVTDPSIYTKMIDTNGSHLVKPLDMREIVRGRRISFRSPFSIGGGCKKVGTGLKKYRCTKWIWKRTYHLADKWEVKQSSHYAYEFIGRR